MRLGLALNVNGSTKKDLCVYSVHTGVIYSLVTVILRNCIDWFWWKLRYYAEGHLSFVIRWQFSLQSTSHYLPCPCKVHYVLTTEKGIKWQLTSSLPCRELPLFIHSMCSAKDEVHFMSKWLNWKVFFKALSAGNSASRVCHRYLPFIEKGRGKKSCMSSVFGKLHQKSCQGALSAQPQRMSTMHDHVAILQNYIVQMLGLLFSVCTSWFQT